MYFCTVFRIVLVSLQLFTTLPHKIYNIKERMKRMRNFVTIAFVALLPLVSWGQRTDTVRLNLDKAIAIALSDNPTIQIADQEIKRVDYSKDAAWQGLIPTLNASVQGSKYLVAAKMSMFGSLMDSPTDYNVAANLNLSLPLVVPGLWRSIQLSDIDLQLAVEKSRGSKIDLKNEVKKAYYSILLAQAGVETLQESVKIADENFQLVKQRFEVGMAAEYDMISAEVQAHNLSPQLVQAQNGADQAKLYMKVLLGIDSRQPIAVEGALSDFEGRLVVKDNAVSLNNNSSLAQIDLQIKMLEKQKQLLATQMMPTLAAFGQFGYTGTGTNAIDINFGGMPITTEARNDWYSSGLIVGLQLNVPIFNGMTNITKIKQVKVATKQLQMQREYAASGLQTQATAQLNNMKVAVERVNACRKGMELAEKGQSIAQKRYETGSGTMLELQSATTALTQARLSYSQAIADYLSAQTDYEKIIGQ